MKINWLDSLKTGLDKNNNTGEITTGIGMEDDGIGLEGKKQTVSDIGTVLGGFGPYKNKFNQPQKNKTRGGNSEWSGYMDDI